MKAIVIQDFGDPEQLALRVVPEPRPKSGDVLVRVRAFGINRAETYMRRGLWGEVANISGIECVGEIVEDPSGQYQPGQKVAAIMGGVTVLASTRNPQRRSLLESLGCNEVLIEQNGLSEILRNQYPRGIDNVMDIVGNTTLLDSLKMVKKGSYVCNAGFLGGGNPFAFNPLTDMPCSANLSFFASFMLGTPDFPLADIPMQTIVDRVSSGIYLARPVKVFDFGDIAKAHALMENNLAQGKLVVRLD